MKGQNLKQMLWLDAGMMKEYAQAIQTDAFIAEEDGVKAKNMEVLEESIRNIEKHLKELKRLVKEQKGKG